MKNKDKQSKNEVKQYCIPMEVTEETIKDYEIDPADVVWSKIGNRWIRAIMIPTTKEFYYDYMRMIWREEKKKQREEPMISLDQLYDDNEYEVPDNKSLEEEVEKKEIIKKLHDGLNKLDEMDRTIMTIFGNGGTESKIGKVVGMSQRGVNKRKHKTFKRLGYKLKDFR